MSETVIEAEPKVECPSQQEILAAVVGVWDGTYVTVAPDGREIDRFTSRQEIRLEGDQWYERIVYIRDGEETDVLDFRARFDENGQLVFDDERCQGRLYTVTADTLLFMYHWKDQPQNVIRELLSLRPPNGKSRVWHRLEGDTLQSVTVIDERRQEGAVPAEWY